MSEFIKTIREVDLTQINEAKFKRSYVGCIVLTQDHKILLQYRDSSWNRFPDIIATFGGRVEHGESPIQALIRELHEELGAIVDESNVVSFGAVTEEVTNHTELVYGYFWHDLHGTITGCYEGQAKYYENINDVFNQPKIMDGVRWMLNECQKQQLLK